MLLWVLSLSPLSGFVMLTVTVVFAVIFGRS